MYTREKIMTYSNLDFTSLLHTRSLFVGIGSQPSGLHTRRGLVAQQET
jgi:hypothetical protein